jgi:hypothetical protein
MTSEMKSHPPDTSAFLTEVGKLANKFAWPVRTFDREGEVVCVALTQADPSFERFVWVYDTDRTMLRCMLVGRQKVSPRRRTAILELCARVNEALPFGCLEYSFGENVLVFRDSTDIDRGPLEQLIGGTTSRVLNLGERYGPAVQSVLKGEKPESTVAKADGMSSSSSASDGTSTGTTRRRKNRS